MEDNHNGKNNEAYNMTFVARDNHSSDRRSQSKKRNLKKEEDKEQSFNREINVQPKNPQPVLPRKIIVFKRIKTAKPKLVAEKLRIYKKSVANLREKHNRRQQRFQNKANHNASQAQCIEDRCYQTQNFKETIYEIPENSENLRHNIKNLDPNPNFQRQIEESKNFPPKNKFSPLPSEQKKPHLPNTSEKCSLPPIKRKIKEASSFKGFKASESNREQSPMFHQLKQENMKLAEKVKALEAKLEEERKINEELQQTIQSAVKEKNQSEERKKKIESAHNGLIVEFRMKSEQTSRIALVNHVLRNQNKEFTSKREENNMRMCSTQGFTQTLNELKHENKKLLNENTLKDEEITSLKSQLSSFKTNLQTFITKIPDF
ncbi:unnamed protein product [Moneuplotes crassus]|uniref:Uncharacterized protein n=1 Tax=Euplotes crassus TaxID=5936 RepID=A0AAD1YA46_EUPCR|nr:unnamed protein product [Moneuplotes crassus]